VCSTSSRTSQMLILCMKFPWHLWTNSQIWSQSLRISLRSTSFTWIPRLCHKTKSKDSWKNLLRILPLTKRIRKMHRLTIIWWKCRRIKVRMSKKVDLANKIIMAGDSNKTLRCHPLVQSNQQEERLVSRRPMIISITQFPALSLSRMSMMAMERRICCCLTSSKTKV
jgi:hypothetical protein